MPTLTSNLSLFRKEWRELGLSFEEQVIKARDEMANAIEQLAKEEIKGKRGSHKGPRGGVVWDKATPNEPPKNRSHHLRSSITWIGNRVGFGSYSAEIGPTMVYSRRVEEGGGNWKSGLKFPYMEPAYRKFKESGIMEQIMTRTVGKI